MRTCDARIYRHPDGSLMATVERVTLADAWPKVRRRIAELFKCEVEDVDLHSAAKGPEFIRVKGLVRATVVMGEPR